MKPASTRRVSGGDIAKAAGVSRATVGFVLNETPGQTISTATRERVLAEAKRLGYRPDLNARALVSGQNRIVLVLLPDFPVEHNLSQLLGEMSDELDTAGYTLVTTDPRAHRNARPLWESLQPDVVVSLRELSDEERSEICAGGSRVVAPTDLALPTERYESDVLRGPVLQVEHLVARGHTKLAYASSAVPRIEAMSRERYGLAAETAHALGADLVEAPVGSESVAVVLAGWLEVGVTAVAAFNDDVAAIALGAALRHGVDVPSRLAIVGHDDTPLASLIVPSLSTVRVDTSGLGKHFAAVALALVRGEPAPRLAPDSQEAALVIRETT